MKSIYDLLIIGGGPAGYTAALYGARAGLKTLVLEKMAAGGQMTQTPQIDNYPGLAEGVDGYTLGEDMRRGAQRFGAETVFSEVYYTDLAADPKRVETGEGTFYGRAVILATGADHRHLGLPREEEMVGRGVGYCAFCDGMFYRGKTVAVVGGGNSAVADALYLSRICEKVILIHRRDTLRADKIYEAQLKNAGNIEFLWNSTVSDLLGQDVLSGIQVTDLLTGEDRELPVEGLFVSIGRAPATSLFRQQLTLDSQGYVAADESTRTSLPGVFAAGDVRSKALRQIVTATADGAVAVHYAQEYLQALPPL